MSVAYGKGTDIFSITDRFGNNFIYQSSEVAVEFAAKAYGKLRSKNRVS